MFELTYNYGKDSLSDYGGEEEFKGNAYAQTAISTTVSCASQLPAWFQHAFCATTQACIIASWCHPVHTRLQD